jgi:tripartite-type tricarboxylate transporter receptor subunit TctC
MRKGFTSSLLAAGAVAIAMAAGPVQAAGIPCGTAKLIVPWSPGGGTDVIFRIIAETVNKTGAKPQIQVVNINGQGGNKGAKEAQKSKPNGCTLFAIHQSAITSYFTGRVDFSVEAFEPVALLSRTPTVFGAHPDTPYNNLGELVAYAKKNPGKVLTAATLGSTSQFIFLMLEDVAGIKLKYVSYDGTRTRMTALLAKNVEIGETNLAAGKKYLQSGQIKGLAITTAERNPEAPDIPTTGEHGIDLLYGTDRGIVMPKGTPKEIIDHYVALLKVAMADPAVTEALKKKGTQSFFVPTDEYGAYFKKTFETWKRIAKEVGAYKRTD